METNTKQNQAEVTLTVKEAEEYCAYKRQKKICEIMAALRESESVLTENTPPTKACEWATRLRQRAVRVTLCDIAYRSEGLKGLVKLDCTVGGNGETAPRVKAYEAKQALRTGAGEITLRLTPSLISACRYTELKKEIRAVKRATKKATFKTRVERSYPHATLARLARISAELGANYFSVPYFEGCERLQAELGGGCLLEVSGVETLPLFKRLFDGGVGRIVTSHAWDIYTEWLKEAEQITVGKRVEKSVDEEKTQNRTEETQREKTNEAQKETALVKTDEEEISTVKKENVPTEKGLSALALPVYTKLQTPVPTAVLVERKEESNEKIS